MKIISKVEINYFRSIYSTNLLKSNDVNVLIGGNDCGKSNILKALNLFFNNETELNTPFYFYDDLSRLREKEARAAKGRASVWVKVTFNNFLKWKSLPDQFWIKRTWNRYEERPVDSYSQDLPSTTVGRFLNKISFHYIPAIRGRDIFTHYLNALHDALIDDEKAGVRGASSKLLDAINQSTMDMGQKINQGLNIQSSIQIPEDLRDLFAALDFSTKFSGYDIPLQKRGDGIQARHIPFILDFIANHTEKKHIWAYEEPENSLELSKAFELAAQFENDFSKENQIFLTTHSPAFYDLKGTSVSKWLISSTKFQDSTDYQTISNEINVGEKADEMLGVAALIASRAKELYIQIEKLNESQLKLEQQIANSNKPQVIVEGITDKLILETAFTKLFPNEDLFCEFVSANGADNLSHSLKSFKTLNKAYPFPIIGIYDNDSKGRSEFRQFRSLHFFEDTFLKELHLEKKIFCGLLPEPLGITGAKEHYRRRTGVDFEPTVPIEFMFNPESIRRAIQANSLHLKSSKIVARNTTGMQLPLDFSMAASEHLPDDYSFLAYEIADNSKTSFSSWIAELEPDAFANFETIFTSLRKIAS